MGASAGMGHPEVSVIVPVYNVGGFVIECVESLARQTYGGFEALIVDDGSTDGSVDVARAVVGDDVRFRFLAKANGGLSSARNFGIDHARGTYLAFLDSDDRYAPDALERLHSHARAHDLDYLDFTAHPFYDTKRARRLRNEDYYERRPEIPGVMTGPELFTAYQRHREYHCSACFHFFKRELLEPDGSGLRVGKLRFEEGIIHEDELFSPLLTARARRAAYLPAALYQRRLREGSIITAKRGMRNVEGMFAVQRELRSFAEEGARSGAHDPTFTDALCQRVAELRDIIAEDAACVPEGELASYAEALGPVDRVEFDLVAIQGARRFGQWRASHEHRLGAALLAGPRWLRAHL